MATLSTLGLWKDGIYLVNDGVAIDFEFYRRQTQHRTKDGGEEKQYDYG